MVSNKILAVDKNRGIKKFKTFFKKINKRFNIYIFIFFNNFFIIIRRFKFINIINFNDRF